MIIVVGILCVLAGISKALMDTYTHHYNSSFLANTKSLFFSKDSWKNKYKDGDKSKGEKFLGSTTVFVFLTDFWHFTQFLTYTFFTIGCVLCGSIGIVNKIDLNISENLITVINVIIGVIYCRVIMNGSFSIVYTLLEKK